jgi:NAD(P)-dependent dehydrogenase (short-subunit alcohol dehydrogenase family)
MALNTVSCGPVAEVGAFVRSNPVDRVGDAGARVLSKLDKRRMFPVADLDLARTVDFLLADTGDNITGQTWSVNGGLSIVG